MSRLRWIAAFIAAPLPPMLLLFPFLLGLAGWRGVGDFAPFVLLIEYAAMIVVGAPLYFAAVRRAPTVWKVVALGACVAPVPWVLLFAWGVLQYPGDGGALAALPIFMLFAAIVILASLLGAFGGWTGWHVAFWKSKRPTT
jgi:uncharacterized BrkB/YihY/UPF0761 family membrane protein